VVGVIANLTVWFALHVMFAEVGTAPTGAAPLPILNSFEPDAAVLTAAAAALMLGLRVGFLPTMLILAVCGLAVSMF
jgi:chromate transporter